MGWGRVRSDKSLRCFCTWGELGAPFAEMAGSFCPAPIPPLAGVGVITVGSVRARLGLRSSGSSLPLLKPTSPDCSPGLCLLSSVLARSKQQLSTWTVHLSSLGQQGGGGGGEWWCVQEHEALGPRRSSSGVRHSRCVSK